MWIHRDTAINYLRRLTIPNIQCQKRLVQPSRKWKPRRRWKQCQQHTVPGTNTRGERMPPLERGRAFVLVVYWAQMHCRFDTIRLREQASGACEKHCRVLCHLIYIGAPMTLETLTIGYVTHWVSIKLTHIPRKQMQSTLPSEYWVLSKTCLWWTAALHVHVSWQRSHTRTQMKLRYYICIPLVY